MESCCPYKPEGKITNLEIDEYYLKILIECMVADNHFMYSCNDEALFAYLNNKLEELQKD